MRLGISEYKGSSEAEWNEEPGAYVLKSQLSQAPSPLYSAEDVTGTGITFDSLHSYVPLRDVCVCVRYTLIPMRNNDINNTTL